MHFWSYLSYLSVKVWLHPGQVASSSQGQRQKTGMKMVMFLMNESPNYHIQGNFFFSFSAKLCFIFSLKVVHVWSKIIYYLMFHQTWPELRRRRYPARQLHRRQAIISRPRLGAASWIFPFLHTYLTYLHNLSAHHQCRPLWMCSHSDPFVKRSAWVILVQPGRY